MSNHFKSLPLQFQHWFKESTPHHFPVEEIAECIQKRSDKTDPDHVEVLRMALGSKTPIDPISIFMVEGKAVLVDGNHRLAAAKELERKTISAHVYKGRTMEDAHIFARWKNNQNGKGLLPQDKAAGIQELLADERYRPLFIEEYRVRPKILAQLAGVSLSTARSHLEPTAKKLRDRRDATILQRRAEGLSDKKIAEEVGFSEQAVRDRRKVLEAGDGNARTQRSEPPESVMGETGAQSESARGLSLESIMVEAGEVQRPPEGPTPSRGEPDLPAPIVEEKKAGATSDHTSVVEDILRQTIQYAGIGLQNVVNTPHMFQEVIEFLRDNPSAHGRLETAKVFIGQLMWMVEKELPEQAKQVDKTLRKAVFEHSQSQRQTK
ncbi:ParB-like nuclease domain-containing protein [Microbulbifer donghaiensis]|uniref:ParB-like nuclease domain-containing protein n=1 Tax=Microbulbifer donghaiensis TaxID=494016 RepID=A0A1M4X5Z2_9GAMM|nr:ParB N-terminal domain-containing protein [Microbulbifer donghaiensis]SHE88846.1 ParB-like nuclease domain-containing protein [Microbulbifer donghaiensis]